MKKSIILLKIKTWVVNNKKEATFLLLVILLASLFRLWKIDQYLPFLGDEGRDVRVVRRFLTQAHPMLIGPRTSIGDMYLGPLYYYFIAPALLLFNFSPVGPAVSVAVLGTATVAFIWYTARSWFGKVGAAVSALLYAVSPTVIENSKHSWNPNIMPFFALLSIWSIWQVWTKKQYIWLLVLGVAYAFVLQSHYLGLLLAPTLLLLGGLAWRKVRQTADGKRFLLFSLFGFAFFVLLMSPLFIFDARHGWHNFQSMFIFFTHRQETVSAKPWTSLHLLWPLWSQIVTSMLGASNKVTGSLLALILAIFATITTLKTHKKFSPLTLLTLWLAVGLLGLGSLKQNIYDHYFGFLWPAPFLLLGALCQVLWKDKLKWLVISAVSALVILNLYRSPLKFPPQNQLKRTQEIDKRILQESQSKPFNIGLIAERNYNEGYLYFFELANAPVRQADPQHLEQTVTDQLFVICEKQDCSPTTDASSQIAHFGPSKVVDQFEVDGVKIYKLAHTQKSKANL